MSQPAAAGALDQSSSQAGPHCWRLCWARMSSTAQKALPPGWASLISVFGRRRVPLLIGCSCWLAKRAGFEAMDQPSPPRPALFLGLMLVLKPSGFRQLLAKLWVTHPILKPFTSSLATSILRPRTRNRLSVRQEACPRSERRVHEHDSPTAPAGI